MSTILITIDALRADHLGQYGYERDTMPALDRLIDDGTLFENAFSNAPFTDYSIPSFHSSVYLGNNPIGDRPTIASTLSEERITTCTSGVQTGPRSRNHRLGFDEYHDFHESYRATGDHSKPIEWVKDTLEPYEWVFNLAKKAYDLPDTLRDRISGPTYSPTLYASAEDVTDWAIDWLGDNRDEEFFVWFHYNDAHRPYGLHDPDPEYAPSLSLERIKEIWGIADETPDDLPVSDYKLLVDQYDSNLRYCSRHLERLFDALDSMGIYQDTNIFFSSDHGEEFYEHGMFTHHNMPYDELIHVPLIVRGPDIESRRIESQRELVDLAPTITDLFDVETPDTFVGQNLFEGEERQVIALGSLESHEGVVAVRWNDWKYISTEEGDYLFDLETDPLEERNLAADRPDVCDDLSSVIPDGLRDSVPYEFEEPEDEEKREQLKALGYI